MLCGAYVLGACVLQGLNTLHPNFVHGDLKADNAMVTMREDGRQMHVVVVDLGSVLETNSDKHSRLDAPQSNCCWPSQIAVICLECITVDRNLSRQNFVVNIVSQPV